MNTGIDFILGNVAGATSISLIGVLVLGLLSGLLGGYVYGKGSSAKMTVAFYAMLFLGWTAELIHIGMLQNACPIHGIGQVFVFLSWSLLLFYLIAGAAYRLSFLGTLTGLLVFVFAGITCFSGMPEAGARASFASDLHVGLAMLSYAGFSLSAVASVAFLIQNYHLKNHKLSGSFHKLPTLNRLSQVAPQLIMWGLVLLTASIVVVLQKLGFISSFKLIMACATWFGYAVLWGVNRKRGMPAKWFALINLILFVASLTVIFASR